LPEPGSTIGAWSLTGPSTRGSPAPRERFEAASHAVRDALAQRLVKTKTIYGRQNAKRIYYLSMGFLLGRSLTADRTIHEYATEIWKVEPCPLP
jgi:glucan phosphorylase